MKSPKRTCCRSLPRCGTCPVRLSALERRTVAASTAGTLVEEILRGRDPRPMPAAVVRALEIIGTAESHHRRPA